MDPSSTSELLILVSKLLTGELKDPKTIATALVDIAVTQIPVADLKGYLDTKVTAAVETAVDLVEDAKVGPAV